MKPASQIDAFVTSIETLSALAAADRAAVLGLLDGPSRRRMKAHVRRWHQAKRAGAGAGFSLSVRLVERGVSAALTAHLARRLPDEPSRAPQLSEAVADFLNAWSRPAQIEPGAPASPSINPRKAVARGDEAAPGIAAQNPVRPVFDMSRPESRLA